MTARYSYSSSPYDQFAQYQYQYGVQSGPRRFFSAVGRFFSRLIVLTLILGAVGGVLFVLHQYGVLLTIARGANVEAQFRDLERRVGAANWGNPLSIERPAETAAIETSPAKLAEDETAKPATVQAAATSEPKTSDGLPIASLDSLPTAPAKGSPEPEPVSAAAPPEAAPVARTEPAPARAPRAARAPKPKPAPKAEEGRQAGRSIPLIQPKPKPEPAPEPVAKAEPPPKPEPKPEPERSAPRASDNPLKAAIRAAMAKK
jgi:hypothetical protein